MKDKVQLLIEQFSKKPTLNMDVLRLIGGKIFGIYGATVMVLVITTIVLIYNVIFRILPYERALKIGLWLNHHFFPKYVIFPLLLVRVKIHGRQQLTNPPYVLISNHRSALDIILNGMTFPHTMQFLSKKEMEKAPLLGYIIKKTSILVDRKSIRSRALSFKAMQHTLNERKNSVMIYPEGTRSKSEDILLQPFHDGAFFLAIKNQTPLVAQVLVYTDRRYPPTELAFLIPGVVHAIWCEPIDTTGMTVADMPQLKERVRQQMLSILEKYYS